MRIATVPQGRAGARRLTALLAVVALAGCGDHSPPRLETLGSGAARVTIHRPSGRAKRSVVVFLHGWGALAAGDYRAWIAHLVRSGHVVVVPRYQPSFVSLPGEALPNALRGIRSAFARLGRPRDVVVVGHSAGGALAADYAAIARAARLPVPRAILLAYPGRAARGLPGRLPELGDQRIPASTRIIALASPGDRVVGTATARAVVRGAGHGRLVLVHDAGVTDHLAPMRDTPGSRRVFWRPLDALLAAPSARRRGA